MNHLEKAHIIFSFLQLSKMWVGLGRWGRNVWTGGHCWCSSLATRSRRSMFYCALRGLVLWSELSVARSTHSNLINKHFPGLFFYWLRDDPSRSFSDLWRSEMLARGETKKSLNLRDSERGAFDLWENRRCLGEGIWAEGAETQLANQTGRE